MATYRQIHMEIWRKDADFQEYSPAAKLLFIYLFSNEATNESGIYEISIKTICNETGLPKKTVVKLLGNGLPTVTNGLGKGLKNVSYEFDNRLIFVHNYRKYNNTGGHPDKILKAIANEYNSTKHSKLWELFFEIYPEIGNRLQRVTNGLPKGLPTVCHNDNDNDNYNYNDKKDINISDQNLEDFILQSSNRIKLTFINFFGSLPYPYRTDEKARNKLYNQLEVKLIAVLKRTRGDPEPFIDNMKQARDKGKDINSLGYFLEGFENGASAWEKLCDQFVFDEHHKIKAEFKRAIDETKALKMIASKLIEKEQPDWMQPIIVEYKKLVQKYELMSDPTEKQLLKDQIVTKQKRFGIG